MLALSSDRRECAAALTSRKVRCSPSSPCSHAKGALRVAPGGSAPPILYVARRGFGGARSGRESRLTDRTGKPSLRLRASNPSSPDGLVEQAVEVVRRPACHLASELDGFCILCRSDEVQREVPDDGHVLRPEALAQAGLVIVEGDVQNPVQAVFDAPMAAHRLAGPRGIEGRRGDLVAGFSVRLAAPLDDRPGYGRCRRPRAGAIPPGSGRSPDSQSTSRTTLVVRCSMRPCPLSWVVWVSTACRRGGGEAGLDLGAQAGLIGLDRQQVVGAGIPDRPGDRAVGGDGIDRDQRAAQPVLLGEPGQQERNGGQLVGFARHRLLPQHQTGGRGDGGDEVDRLRPRGAVVAAPRRLAPRLRTRGFSHLVAAAFRASCRDGWHKTAACRGGR